MNRRVGFGIVKGKRKILADDDVRMENRARFSGKHEPSSPKTSDLAQFMQLKITRGAAPLTESNVYPRLSQTEQQQITPTKPLAGRC